MKIPELFDRYQQISLQIQRYYANYPQLSASKRAEDMINNQRAMSKLFDEKLQSEWLGNKIDILG